MKVSKGPSFLEAAASKGHDAATDLMAASLIRFLGQARFPSFFWVIVTHPGHASLRSLVDAVMAPLHAYVGSDVESLAKRRASRCASTACPKI